MDYKTNTPTKQPSLNVNTCNALDLFEIMFQMIVKIYLCILYNWRP